jgi:hypothetical protein
MRLGPDRAPNAELGAHQSAELLCTTVDPGTMEGHNFAQFLERNLVAYAALQDGEPESRNVTLPLHFLGEQSWPIFSTK